MPALHYSLQLNGAEPLWKSDKINLLQEPRSLEAEGTTSMIISLICFGLMATGKSQRRCLERTGLVRLADITKVRLKIKLWNETTGGAVVCRFKHAGICHTPSPAGIWDLKPCPVAGMGLRVMGRGRRPPPRRVITPPRCASPDRLPYAVLYWIA